MIWKLIFLIYIIGCFVILGFYEYNRGKNPKEVSTPAVLIGVLLWPLVVSVLIVINIKDRLKK